MNNESYFSGTYKSFLYEHGAVLLQNFPLGDASRFNRFIKHLDGVEPIVYTEGGGARHAAEERVAFLWFFGSVPLELTMYSETIPLKQ